MQIQVLVRLEFSITKQLLFRKFESFRSIPAFLHFQCTLVRPAASGVARRGATG